MGGNWYEAVYRWRLSGTGCFGQKENRDADVYVGFHEIIRKAVLTEGKDLFTFVRGFILDHPAAVIVADEVGAGVVPVSEKDRVYREAVGRALCMIAQEADQVTRCICGIGVRIK